MAQVTSGVRSILSVPLVYEAFQKLMGTDRLRQYIIDRYVTPHRVGSFLDIGCGPAEILSFMPDIDYYGYDISEDYIAAAERRFGDRGTFRAELFDAGQLDALPPIDMGMMFGVLHHIDDETAAAILEVMCAALRPGGRLLCIDPVLVQEQNPVARFLVSKDRGQNVRSPEAYRQLVDPLFQRVELDVRHRRWPPYTHCIMECWR